MNNVPIARIDTRQRTVLAHQIARETKGTCNIRWNHIVKLWISRKSAFKYLWIAILVINGNVMVPGIRHVHFTSKAVATYSITTIQDSIPAWPITTWRSPASLVYSHLLTNQPTLLIMLLPNSVRMVYFPVNNSGTEALSFSLYSLKGRGASSSL